MTVENLWYSGFVFTVPLSFILYLRTTMSPDGLCNRLNQLKLEIAGP